MKQVIELILKNTPLKEHDNILHILILNLKDINGRNTTIDPEMRNDYLLSFIINITTQLLRVDIEPIDLRVQLGLTENVDQENLYEEEYNQLANILGKKDTGREVSSAENEIRYAFLNISRN